MDYGKRLIIDKVLCVLESYQTYCLSKDARLLADCLGDSKCRNGKFHVFVQPRRITINSVVRKGVSSYEQKY